MGTGPFFNDIGGNGMALIILAFTLIAFFNWNSVIVDIKLIIVCDDLNFNSLMIFSPTVGVIDKKTQLHEFTISWLFLAIVTFLNFFLSFWAINLFLGEINIFSKDIFELQIPVTTDEAIFPVPINPNFIFIVISAIFSNLGKKKPPIKGVFKFV